jgi:hypothetical protein
VDHISFEVKKGRFLVSGANEPVKLPHENALRTQQTTSETHWLRIRSRKGNEGIKKNMAT